MGLQNPYKEEVDGNRKSGRTDLLLRAVYARRLMDITVPIYVVAANVSQAKLLKERYIEDVDPDISGITFWSLDEYDRGQGIVGYVFIDHYAMEVLTMDLTDAVDKAYSLADGWKENFMQAMELIKTLSHENILLKEKIEKLSGTSDPLKYN